jgi:acyl-CoA synthetase (AMP-forming)/AMP-acid ligase II
MLYERILRAVERNPDAPAFIAAGWPVTYRQLEALVASAVTQLRGQGVRPGDVVGLAMRQSPL